MEEEVLFEDTDCNNNSSSSIEVVIENIDLDKNNIKDVPLIDGQGIYDFEIDNMEEKPWEKPGADITDYFNYGFNESTWKKYCASQREFVKGVNSVNGKQTTTERPKNKNSERQTRKSEVKVDEENYNHKENRKKFEKGDRGEYEDKEVRGRRQDRYERIRPKRDYEKNKRYERRS